MSVIDSVMPHIVNGAPNRHVFNPWASARFDTSTHAPEGCRQRLRAHFDCVPRLLLVGEAPGYQGCAISGVPFTSEAQLVRGDIPRLEQTIRLTNRLRPYSEPSATVMWGILRELDLANTTVMWNAFPWHPHEEGNPLSNRTPSAAELRTGRVVLAYVIDACQRANRDVRVVAVGRKAEALAREVAGMSATPSVRHPSMGGAREFREQLREMFRR